VRATAQSSPIGARQAAARLALLAALFHALLPLLGHTGLSLDTSRASAAAAVHPGHGTGDQPQRPIRHEPCPVCVAAHAVSLALAAPAVLDGAFPTIAPAHAQLRADRPEGRPTHLRPQPRAPPTIPA
jgi:hypothetical protein